MDQKTPSMNQKIFELGLPTETISLYLLCCSLADSRASISEKNLLGIWNSTRDVLTEGLDRLENRNILIRTCSDGEENIYHLTDSNRWKV